MTCNKHFKQKIRDRMSKTGESYTAALHALSQQPGAGSLTSEPSNPSDLVPFEVEIDLDEQLENGVHSDTEGSFTPESEPGDPFRDDDEHSSPWEEEAREAVESALAEASFELEDDEGLVWLPATYDGSKHPHPVACRSIDALRDELLERAESAWCASVPWEGGPVFDPDCASMVADVLNQYHDQLADLGWDL